MIVLGMERSTERQQVEYDFHIEIWRSPGIGKTVFGPFLLGQLASRFGKVDSFCLLYWGRKTVLFTRRWVEEWDFREMEKLDLGPDPEDLRRTIAVFDGISEKRFLKESGRFRQSLLMGSIVIGSPGMTGWWQKYSFGFYKSWYMPLWEQKKFEDWVSKLDRQPKVNYSGGIVESWDVELPREGKSMDVFGYNSRSILERGGVLENLKRALTERIALEPCFNGRYWDPNVVRLGCHHLIALRLKQDDWTMVRETYLGVREKLMIEVMNLRYQEAQV